MIKKMKQSLTNYSKRELQAIQGPGRTAETGIMINRRVKHKTL
jgi:hypothetical protein